MCIVASSTRHTTSVVPSWVSAPSHTLHTMVLAVFHPEHTPTARAPPLQLVDVRAKNPRYIPTPPMFPNPVGLTHTPLETCDDMVVIYSVHFRHTHPKTTRLSSFRGPGAFGTHMPMCVPERSCRCACQKSTVYTNATHVP